MTVMKKIITLLLTMILAGCLYAQSADVITEILNTDEVTFGQICYLSATRQGLISDTDSYEKAVSVLKEKGDISENIDATEVVTLKDLANVYTKIWDDLSGGLMYKITKGSPRYSFKQLKSDGVLTEKSDPSSKVNGFEALNILSYCMTEYGSDEECMNMEIE